MHVEYRSGHFVLTIRQMLDAIKDDLHRYEKTTGLVYLLFCPPNSRFHKALLENAEFWNRYSDRHVTIFFPGYVGMLSSPDEEFVDIVKPEYDYNAYMKVVEDFEKVTTWKYSGQTELFGSTVELVDGRVKWDFDTAVSVHFESIDHDKKLDLGTYVIGLINSAKRSPDAPLAEAHRQNWINFILAIAMAPLPSALKEIAKKAARYNFRKLKGRDDDDRPSPE